MNSLARILVSTVVLLLCSLLAWQILLRYALQPLGAGLPADLGIGLLAHRFWIYLHAFAAIVAVALGPWQFFPAVRRHWPRVHRWSGRIYLVVGVLCGGGAGLVLSLTAHGGVLARSGFLAVALLWLVTGWMAYVSIRAGDVRRHRDWMYRNFALTFGAVTLRLYLGVAAAAGFSFDSAYPVIAWLSWLPNILLVDAWMCWQQRRPPSRSMSPVVGDA